jgi:hypothetical protein
MLDDAGFGTVSSDWTLDARELAVRMAAAHRAGRKAASEVEAGKYDKSSVEMDERRLIIRHVHVVDVRCRQSRVGVWSLAHLLVDLCRSGRLARVTRYSSTDHRRACTAGEEECGRNGDDECDEREDPGCAEFEVRTESDLDVHIVEGHAPDEDHRLQGDPLYVRHDRHMCVEWRRSAGE